MSENYEISYINTLFFVHFITFLDIYRKQVIIILSTRVINITLLKLTTFYAFLVQCTAMAVVLNTI